MRVISVPMVCMSLLLVAALASAETYHVDCATGSDAADGTSATKPWKTLEKASATTLAPGDAVLLRRGTRCSGTLWPKGSGTAQRPIRAGSYGEGPRPVIDAGGAPAALKLFNQQGWHLEDIETIGGSPHGIYIGGDAGPLAHFRVRNVVVTHVTGQPTTKYSGLLVVDGTPGAVMEDIVIDGVVAHHTTQWAGIIVVGPSRERRTRDVTVRNTIVHDVFGDGIVLYQVEQGLIEKSAAWLTGLQPRETIGTPNAIWTWRCRACTVQLTEGFFIDSPGVDGGVYDIDWGNDDNIVQHNYGHDAQGYCIAVFGASNETTTNSIVRHNVCVNNGRSPKLARHQGDFYVATWETGALDGLLVSNNTFYWNPPIDAPAVQVDQVEFTGRRPNRFSSNLVYSAVPAMVHSSSQLRFDGNIYWYGGSATPTWSYGGEQLHTPVGGEFVDPQLDALLRPLMRSTLAKEAVGAAVIAPDAAPPNPQPGRWTLRLSAARSPEHARSQLVFLEAAMAQYGDTRLDAVVVGTHDWPLARVRSAANDDLPDRVLLSLLTPSGAVAREWSTFALPADLGLTLRHAVGAPAGAR